MRSFYTVLVALPALFAAPVEQPKRGSPIHNQWLVKMQDGASSEELQYLISEMSKRYGNSPTDVYDMGDFKGFSIEGPPAVSIAINNDDSVDFVEQDQLVTTSSLVTQANPPYGLARISHRKKGTTTFLYDSSAGEGTYAYIIDTGIYPEHSEFEGRVTFGANFADDDDRDVNGHGTHVSGTIGGKTYGISKKTNLIGVKVLGGTDGSGSISGVISGINWAVQNAKNNSRIDKSVANLSLGSDFSDFFNAAVKAAVEQGLFVAVAAGNQGVDASTKSPGSEPKACTIGAIDVNDVRTDFSNYGLVVDVFAPGVDVQSAWIAGPDSSAFLTGTSMASPHIAGVGAYLLGLGYAHPRGDELCSDIKTISTKRAVVDAGEGSGRKIAFNGGGKKVVQGLSTRWARKGVTWG